MIRWEFWNQIFFCYTIYFKSPSSLFFNLTFQKVKSSKLNSLEHKSYFLEILNNNIKKERMSIKIRFYRDFEYVFRIFIELIRQSVCSKWGFMSYLKQQSNRNKLNVRGFHIYLHILLIIYYSHKHTV